MSRNLILNFTETVLLIQDLKYGTPYQNISEMPLVSNNLGINILNGSNPSMNGTRRSFHLYLGTELKLYRRIYLKGKATLRENIIEMKDILFPNILVQVS